MSVMAVRGAVLVRALTSKMSPSASVPGGQVPQHALYVRRTPLHRCRRTSPFCIIHLAIIVASLRVIEDVLFLSRSSALFDSFVLACLALPFGHAVVRGSGQTAGPGGRLALIVQALVCSILESGARSRRRRQHFGENLSGEE